MLSSHLNKLRQAYWVVANNTDVGKTLITAGLCRGALRLNHKVIYFKPVQTGFPEDSDVRFIQRYVNNEHKGRFEAFGLYNFKEPLSPHLARDRVYYDEEVINEIENSLSNKIQNMMKNSKDEHLSIFLETAGGALSPSLSGSLQLDAYRKLRYPIILIGDSRLGGISTTLATYESLKLRGYDINHILLFENERYQNNNYLSDYFDKESIPLTSLPYPPEKVLNKEEDVHNLLNYYQKLDSKFLNVNQSLKQICDKRYTLLDEMSNETQNKVWWPFTQHHQVQRTGVIDSAYRSEFQFYQSKSTTLHGKVDGCASWWTQTLGHGDPKLALEVGYASGRYGHAMFPENIHEPAYMLSSKLLTTVGKGWANRVFFSDNGSTGVEVAIKMALNLSQQSKNKSNLDNAIKNGINKEMGIVGVKGAYHGDTIGAMDAANPNVYNEKVHWYRPRGHWFAPPTILFKNGQFLINLPNDIVPHFDSSSDSNDSKYLQFNQIESIFDYKSREATHLYKYYINYISSTLHELMKQGQAFGALLIEPILLGAGGMQFVDPLFQRALIQVTRHEFDLPIIFDEVFSGFYRLGVRSGAELLDMKPDIAVYSKGLTGGLVPLSVTLASERVFESFRSSSKANCLLHGHSYTAYPVGCQAAFKSLERYEQMFPTDNSKEVSLKSSLNHTTSIMKFETDFLDKLSKHPSVDGVVHLGTVLAIHLHAPDAGYASEVARTFIEMINANNLSNKNKDNELVQFFIRPLGNVVYFMFDLNVEFKVLQALQKQLIDALDSISKKDQK